MPPVDWDAELTETDRDALIERLAQRVAKYGLQTPAIFMLELHKPLAFFAGQSLVLGSGFLAPLFGAQNVQHLSKLMESRENIERLIRRIEELAVTPQKGSVS